MFAGRETASGDDSPSRSRRLLNRFKPAGSIDLAGEPGANDRAAGARPKARPDRPNEKDEGSAGPTAEKRGEGNIGRECGVEGARARAGSSPETDGRENRIDRREGGVRNLKSGRRDDRRGKARRVGEQPRRVIPTRRQTVATDGLQNRRRSRGVRIVEIAERRNPVPMQDRHVGRPARPRMPVQKVIVHRTGLARSVMMADVVIIGAGQRNARQAEDQKGDPQSPRSASAILPASRHRDQLPSTVRRTF